MGAILVVVITSITSISIGRSTPILLLLGLNPTRILLANSEAPNFRLTHAPAAGPEAWSNPCGTLGFVGGKNGFANSLHEEASPPRMKIAQAIFTSVSTLKP
jgi:hypothetical protein